MAENPLLPNKKLKELYALMQRIRTLMRPGSQNSRYEALLAPVVMHLEPGDFVSPPLDIPVAATLLAERTTVNKPPFTTLPAGQRLATAAGIARGLQMARDTRIAVFFAEAGPASARREAGWAEALTYASRSELPLLLVCTDIQRSSRVATNSNVLTWATMGKLAKPLRLPVLSVDGSDAVAVYRVVQESVLRARTVGGTAVIWCSFPAPGKLPPAADPVQHMKRYLAVRNLLAPASPAKKRLR